MTTRAQVKERLQDLLEERAEQLGRETGFVKRKRQLSGADFVQGLVFGLLQVPENSTEELATILGTPKGANQRVGSVPAFHGRSRDGTDASLGLASLLFI